VIVGDGVIVGDLTLLAQLGSIDGDATESMELVVDTGLDCLDY